MKEPGVEEVGRLTAGFEGIIPEGDNVGTQTGFQEGGFVGWEFGWESRAMAMAVAAVVVIRAGVGSVSIVEAYLNFSHVLYLYIDGFHGSKCVLKIH